MGMYTEILVKAKVKEDIPSKVYEVLNYLFNDVNNEMSMPEELPEHEFFNTPKWGQIGGCDSYYHIPWTGSQFSDNYIFFHSYLKNYNEEIPLFFDWVDPYLEVREDECIGYYWHEEAEEPALVYKR